MTRSRTGVAKATFSLLALLALSACGGGGERASSGGTAAPGPESTVAKPACPSEAVKVEAGPWVKAKTGFNDIKWEMTATITNPAAEVANIGESVMVINLTGGTTTKALSGKFNGIPDGSGAAVLVPLVPPGQSIKVKAEANTATAITAITTSEIFAAGTFFPSGCKPTFVGARPFSEAPRASSFEAGSRPGDLTSCGPGFSTCR